MIKMSELMLDIYKDNKNKVVNVYNDDFYF